MFAGLKRVFADLVVHVERSKVVDGIHESRVDHCLIVGEDGHFGIWLKIAEIDVWCGQRIFGGWIEHGGAGWRPFAPFFAERVMQRIQAERQSAREDDFFMSLIWTFRRVAIAGVIAVALLITTNILYKQDLSLDSILAVPQVTLENALELDELIVRE